MKKKVKALKSKASSYKPSRKVKAKTKEKLFNNKSGRNTDPNTSRRSGGSDAGYNGGGIDG